MKTKTLLIGTLLATAGIGLVYGKKKLLDEATVSDGEGTTEDLDDEGAIYATEESDWEEDGMHMGDFLSYDSDDCEPDDSTPINNYRPYWEYAKMPEDVTDEEYIHCLDLMKKYVAGEISFQDMNKREKKIVEPLIYGKLRKLPKDPHLNEDSWFWASHLRDFVQKGGNLRITENIKDMANALVVPEWVWFRIRELA